MPYRDYIAWLQHQDLTEAERFWRETLKGFDAPVTLNLKRRPKSCRRMRRPAVRCECAFRLIGQPFDAPRAQANAECAGRVRGLGC